MMNRFSRRSFLRKLGLVCSALSILPRTVYGKALSAEPCGRLSGQNITWIVPNKTGGGNDLYARILEPFLEEALQAEILIRNLPGAGGIIGARTVMQAPPDGHTIGLINGTGLLAVVLGGDTRAPSPLTDFTPLIRLTGNQPIWITARHSQLHTMGRIFEENLKTPLVVGINDVGTSSFTHIALTSHLLGLNIEMVPGYQGSSASTLAVMRGEVDMAAHNITSVLPHIIRGDVVPVLQVSDTPVSDHPVLSQTPVLGGENGIAVQRAKLNGQTPDEAQSDTHVLMDLLAPGRLIVAPPGLSEDQAQCLESSIMHILEDIHFQKQAQQAGLVLDPVSSTVIKTQLQTVLQNTHRLAPVIIDAIRKVRG